MKSIILSLIILFPINSIFAQNELPKEKCLTHNKFDDRYASYSPDGKWIVFESNRDGNWGIYLMDSAGHNEQQLVKNDTENRRPSWHPNGKQILFESNRNGIQELYTIRIKNRKEKKLSREKQNGKLIFANYSPDGKTIAVSLEESGNKGNIILLNKKGKLIERLTDNDKRNFYPKWSKDGKEIVYFSRKDTDNKDDEIYRLNVNTKQELRLTEWHKHNFCPSWSNDDTKIVYVTSMEDTRPEIYMMDKEGNNQTRITNNKDGETLPCWHPSENRILITAYRNGNYEICELKW